MAEDRSVDISISINLNVGGEPWSVGHSIRYIVDSNRQFNETALGIRAGVRILAAVQKAATDKERAVLEEGDYKLLFEAFEKPAVGYVPSLSQKNAEGLEVPLPPIPGRLFLPIIEAMSDEATKKTV